MPNVCSLSTLRLQKAVIGVVWGNRFQKPHAKSALLRRAGKSLDRGVFGRHKIFADSRALFLLMKYTKPASALMPMLENAPVT